MTAAPQQRKPVKEADVREQSRAGGRGRPFEWTPELYEVTDGGYTTECWLWLRAKTVGYGIFREQYAHRVSYERFIGPIPDGLEIDHLCKNKACVNPDHLDAVTHVENIRRCHRTKVTQEQVEAIRRETGLNREIAAKYGLEESYVSRLRRGVSRPH